MQLSAYLVAWRTTALPDREVVDALVHPGHAGPSADLTRALALWPGRYYWSDEPDGRHLILTRPAPPEQRPRERWLLHAVLFIATLLTTTYAGAVLAGSAPSPGTLTFFHLFIPSREDALAVLTPGLVFSVPLLGILLCHEMGHYVTARRYLLDVSPPFFIPVPLWPSFIGTMGAFIRLRTLLSDRRQLFDVGIAGPIAGILVAVPIFWYGLLHSGPLPPMGEAQGMLVSFGGVTWILGDSLVTLALRHLAVGNATIHLHPAAFAGWFGILVTTLNLFPISQLDGGHILFAALPRWHERIALLFWVLLAALGLYLWIGWFYWGFLVLLLSRGRLGHPPVLDSWRPLPRSRRWLAWVGLLLFVLTFSPTPFRF